MLRKMRKKTIIPIASIAMLSLIGFATLKPKSAYSFCETPLSSAIALGIWIADGLSFIQSFQGGLSNFITVDMTTGQNEVDTRVQEFDENTRQGWADWWNNDKLPAMRDQTTQISVGIIDETRNKGSMIDAELQEQAIKEQQKLEAEAARKLKDGEILQCRLDTAYPHLGVRSRVADNISRGSANTAFPRSTGGAGTPEADGEIAAYQNKVEEYVNKYCDKDANGGDSLCTADSVAENADLTVGSSFLWGETLSFDLEKPGYTELFDDIKRIFIDQNTPDSIPDNLADTPEGIKAFNDIRSNAARKQAIHAVLGQIMADRVMAPDLDPAMPHIQEIRLQAGAPPSTTTVKPSKNEIMHTLTKSIVSRPNFMHELTTNPYALVKDSVGTKTLQLQQINETYNRMEELGVMLASEFAHDIESQELGSTEE